MKKDLLNLLNYSEKEILGLISLAEKLKKERKTKKPLKKTLNGKNTVMIFEKPSLRTRVTFEIAMNDLGGSAVYLPPESIQIGTRETIEDISRNLDRWVDGIVGRTFEQKTLEELARYTSVPVINALSDDYHPCQALAFALTLKEYKKKLKGCQVVFVGDGNNVCNSLMILSSKLGIHFTVAAPEGYAPNPGIVKAAKENAKKSKAGISVTTNVQKAVNGADVIYTDTWASMGQEAEISRRRKAFADYTVNSKLVNKAKKGCLVSHCLPAHRGEEISDDILDNSMAFDEAENRLHVQKAVLSTLLK